MPIRLCQKCGLKVLIDDSQSATNPFYCQRCTTAMKGGGEREDIGAYAAPPAAAPAPARTSGPVRPAATLGTPSPVASGARPATIKVLCPYCKASFNGRVPQKPARGSCPVCQKELILLPDGDIRPSAGFDLNSWQAGKDSLGGAAPKESGTQVLMKKYAAAPPPPPEPAPEPALVVDMDVPEESAALPSWLDDSSSGKKAPPKQAPQPVPETDIEIDIVQPKAEEPEPVRLEELPPPPPPAPRGRPGARPAAAAASSQSTAARPAVAAPVAAPKPESASGLRKPVPARGTDRRGSDQGLAEPAATGAGLCLLALILVLAPLGAVGGMLSAREKLVSQPFVTKLGTRFSKGLKALHLKLFPPPKAPAPVPVEEVKPVEVKPPEAPPQPTAEDRKRDEDELTKAHLDLHREERSLKQKLVGATPAEKAGLEPVEADIKKRQSRIAELEARYQKAWGKAFKLPE